MSFIKHHEYEFDTTQDALDHIEERFGNSQSLTSDNPVWGSVVVGADVLVTHIENLLERESSS